MKLLDVQFLPLSTTLKRRLQPLAVLWWCFQFLLLGPLGTLLMISLLYTEYFAIPLLYYFWIIYDRDTICKGSRLQMWYRRLPFWWYIAQYFPMKLHKTADLDPNENYIFGVHPHGIYPVGCVIHFATEATGFSKIFPGIKPRVVGLNINFWMPFRRETFMLSGICSVSKESIEWIISENGKGNAAVIAIGGSSESLDAIPRKMELTLKHRKGFVKIALKHGVSLVPVISFGDNELFSQTERSESSLTKRIQRKLTRILTFAPVLFYGRWMLQFVPYRKPVNTIVGKPIKVPQIVHPSVADINKYHNLYIESLCELFYANRKQFAEDPNVEIVFK